MIRFVTVMHTYLEPDPPYPTEENTVDLGEDVSDHPGLLPGGRLLQHGHHTSDLPEPQRLSLRRYAAHAAALCRIVRQRLPQKIFLFSISFQFRNDCVR